MSAGGIGTLKQVLLKKIRGLPRNAVRDEYEGCSELAPFLCSEMEEGTLHRGDDNVFTGED
jgi:hypothetical protein